MGMSRQCLLRGAFLCVTVLLTGTVAFAAPLTIGPVEQINLKSSTLVVLGQTYHLVRSTKITDRATGAGIGLSSIAPGTLVVIDGAESASGSVNVRKVISLS